MEDGRALQDVLKVECFGCGALNERGLQIKSRWEGDELVCRWRPPPHHIGHPGVVYGGTIASVVDCHAIWTAMATHCRDTGTDIATVRTPTVTGRLAVNYLKPARIDAELVLRARVTDAGGRRATVRCRVLQDGEECAIAEVITVRLQEGGEK
jgi:acyl-coenzyme A thioesterase PaaI-like protein